LRRQSGLAGFWHPAQIHCPHPLAPTIHNRDGCRRPLLPFPVAQWDIDPITPYCEGWLQSACRGPCLMEPADDLIDLGLLAMGRHPCTQTAQELAQCGTRPVHPMVML
jgi:hypothetical protein